MSRDGCVALPRGVRVCLQFVIVVFPDNTRLLFFKRTTIDLPAIPVAFRGRFDCDPRLYACWEFVHIRVFAVQEMVG